MKSELLEFLLEQREALKSERIFMYFRLSVKGTLSVGFDYKIIYMRYWDNTPHESSLKRCSVKVDFDNLTEEKRKKFMKSYEKCLNEIRDEQAKHKGHAMELKIKIDNLLDGTNVK